MITLRDITKDNFEAVLGLEVGPGQEDLGPSAAESLARAFLRIDGPQYTYMPKAVYYENQPVGFIMIIYDPGSTDDYWLSGAIIDKKHQGLGHAKGAIIAVIELVRHKLINCRVLGISCLPDNQKVINMATGLGFAATGEMKNNEIVYRMNIRK